MLEDLLKETEETKLEIKEVEADFVSCYEGETTIANTFYSSCS